MLKTTSLVLMRRMVRLLGVVPVQTSWERAEARSDGLHNYIPLQGQQGCLNQHGSGMGKVVGQIVMFGMVIGKVSGAMVPVEVELGLSFMAVEPITAEPNHLGRH